MQIVPYDGSSDASSVAIPTNVQQSLFKHVFDAFRSQRTKNLIPSSQHSSPTSRPFTLDFKHFGLEPQCCVVTFEMCETTWDCEKYGQFAKKIHRRFMGGAYFEDFSNE
ncbi:hypothetical protein BLNAU_23064 [Blattamonas nauphoetae]|uniref:Uncharacterized protein n=1 Tax=Blattamonas nauphoetae TaxID=2049346 RepID=A0ABQ9WVG7_9EUKA|nr:hypothetical protein BLNAU_23064 [Blattamonas nauphoetae]